ncbi:MAG: capsular polysaccharide transport system permease protein [Halocynthiibacter sp.]|jgi:capsular polysaccharide transport system permease protein
MTTKPKAKKFRIRRTGPLEGAVDATPQAQAEQAPKAAPSAAAPQPQQQAPQSAPAAPAQRPAAKPAPKPQAPSDEGLFDNDEDGFSGMGMEAAPKPQPARPQAAPAGARPARAQSNAAAGITGDVTPAAEMSLDEEIDAIRKEGLTGRQLRMARRVAQKHNIAPTSDFDAVRLLRKQGIDPFQRGTMLEMVQPASGMGPAPGDKKAQLPQTVKKPQLPATNVIYDQSQRDAEIMRIQRDIGRRRRRKMLLLVTRLGFFVFLPTFIAAWYYYAVATPMYGTKSEFVIQQAESPAGGALGGLFSGTSFATSQDSIAVQSYLQSRDAMLRLDEDLGYKEHFSQPNIDSIQRLPEDPSNEQAYKTFQKNVTIGYDPTEGIIKMEVIAASPEKSQAFSEALINYAEERVDQLTQRLREDQMQGAAESFASAEAKMFAAQERVLTIQEQLGVLDPISESTALMAQISTFEIQLQQKKLQLDQLLDNSRPNKARVDGTKGDIGRLENVIANLRSQMTTTNTGGDSSLARITSELRVAEVDLQTRQLMMQQALTQLETARIEANRQVRYLSEGVSPVAPDEPTYPRKFENTILAFLIFAGIYLMASLTASVLREQVSS